MGDVELIVQAIEGLHSNLIKDYILPVGTVLTSGLLGVGVAYYTVNQQEHTKIQIEKIKAINNTLLKALEVRDGLIAIKQNYFGKISDEPINRMLTVPPILLTTSKIDIDLGALSFIAPSVDTTDVHKFESIGYISTIFSNYNILLDAWDKRNTIIEGLMPQIIPLLGQPLDFKKIQEILGRGNIKLLSELTERVLHLTDDILKGVSEFLIGFGELAKRNIDKRVTKKFGNVLTIVLPDLSKLSPLGDLNTNIPEVNFDQLSELLSIEAIELKDRYRPLY